MADNPKWKPFLDVIPEMLHDTVKPILQQWDQGVTQLLEAERKKVEPFKPFIDANVDPQFLIQAYQLAEQVQNNPAEVAANMIEQFDLDYVSASEAASSLNSSDVDLDLGGDMGNLEDDPKFKALQEGIATLTDKLTEMTEQQQQDQQTKEFESYMESLHKDHGDFNDRFVTALIAQGLSGEDAIAEYRKEIGQATEQLTPEQIAQKNAQQNQQGQGVNENGTTPPVVLGAGIVGSGSDQQPVNFGDMKKTDVNAYVSQLLQNAGNTQG